MAMRREQVAAALRYLQDKADLRGRFERATSLDPQEQDLADIAIETGASLVPGVGPALAARDFERARRANDPAGMAMAAASAVPGGKLAGLLKRYDPVMRELDVYHGTPHRFPATEANPLGEFDASKIGTGEGAQAYGHGIYYAENPDVAKGYQSSLSADRGFSFEGKTGLTRAEVQDMVNAKYGKGYLDNILRPSGVADSFIDDMVTGVTRAEGSYPKQYKAGSERAKLYDELRGKITHASPGSLYKADLPDEMIDRMLDWDKPLSQQPKAVQDAFKDIMQSELWDADTRRLIQTVGMNPNEIKGKKLYELLSVSDELAGRGELGKAASEELARRGVPGIKYLDAGSRGQGGTGTRNFVVFPGEEKKVRILERNGQKAPPQKIAQALEATSKNQNLVNIYNKYAKREIESANKRIVDPDEPYLTHQPISNLKELDELTDPIFNYAKANVLKHIGEQNGFKVKIEGSNVSPSVYAKFTKVDDGGMTDFKVRISDHADVSRNKPAGEKKAYDINPESNGSMEEIIRLLNDPNWLKQFYEVD